MTTAAERAMRVTVRFDAQRHGDPMGEQDQFILRRLIESEIIQTVRESITMWRRGGQKCPWGSPIDQCDPPNKYCVVCNS